MSNWTKIAIVGGILALIMPFIMFGAAMGLVSAAACEAWDEIPFVECEFLLEGGNGNQCGGISPNMSGNVPEEWASIFSEAAEEYGVNPNFVAAIFLTEHGNKWNPVDHSFGTSEKGAAGPMQFMPGTWSDYGIDGDGDGTADRQDPTDAIHSATSMFSASPKKGPAIYGSVTPDMSVGSISKPWAPGTMIYASALYNAGPGTIEDNTNPQDGLDDPEWGRVWEVQRYVQNIDALLSSDLTKGGVTAENGYTGESGGRKDHKGNYLPAWSDPYGMGVGEDGDGDDEDGSDDDEETSDTCGSDVDPPEGEPGNWPQESCSVRPDPTTGGNCITPRTKKVVDVMLSQGVSNGQIACFSQRTWGEHPLGKACDITFGAIGSFASGSDLEAGNRLANFLMENYDTWAIDYVIWQGKIWSTSRYDQGWRIYRIGSCDPTTVTCGHYDHVHVSVY